MSFRRGGSREFGTKQRLHPLSLYFVASAAEILSPSSQLVGTSVIGT